MTAPEVLYGRVELRDGPTYGHVVDAHTERRPRRLAHSYAAEVADLRQAEPEPVATNDTWQLLRDVAGAFVVLVLCMAALWLWLVIAAGAQVAP